MIPLTIFTKFSDEPRSITLILITTTTALDEEEIVPTAIDSSENEQRYTDLKDGSGTFTPEGSNNDRASEWD